MISTRFQKCNFAVDFLERRVRARTRTRFSRAFAFRWNSQKTGSFHQATFAEIPEYEIFTLRFFPISEYFYEPDNFHGVVFVGLLAADLPYDAVLSAAELLPEFILRQTDVFRFRLILSAQHISPSFFPLFVFGNYRTFVENWWRQKHFCGNRCCAQRFTFFLFQFILNPFEIVAIHAPRALFPNFSQNLPSVLFLTLRENF